MMFVRSLLLATLLCAAAPGHAATARELDATELRQLSRGGEMISLKRAIESVAKATGGTPIEARAFEADGVFYRIVLKKANGSVISIILNARTGEQVGKNSAIGRQISAAAGGGSKGNKGKSQSAKSKDKATGNGSSGGNGNAGGNGSSGGNGGSGGGGGNSGGGGGGGGNGGGGGKGKN